LPFSPCPPQRDDSCIAGSVHLLAARPVDAAGLIGALTARGLSASVVDVDGCLEIEIAAGPQEESALAEVSDVLDSWLAEQELPFVPLRIGRRSFAVSPPVD
jgi:hypothetical protein